MATLRVSGRMKQGFNHQEDPDSCDYGLDDRRVRWWQGDPEVTPTTFQTPGIQPRGFSFMWLTECFVICVLRTFLLLCPA